MENYSFAGCSYVSLLQIGKAAFRENCIGQAKLLGVIAEIDAQRHYLAGGYPTLYAWCAGELGLKGQRAYKRISAASHALRFPAILPMVADGRLCLTTVNQIGPHLTVENVEPLLAAAAHKSKSEVEWLLSELQPNLLTVTEVPAPSGGFSPERIFFSDTELDPAAADPPARIASPCAPIPAAAPLIPRRIVEALPVLHVAMPQSTHEKLYRLRVLLGHQVQSGNLADVLDKVFDIGIRHLEHRRRAASERRTA